MCATHRRVQILRELTKSHAELMCSVDTDEYIKLFHDPLLRKLKS